MDSHPDRYSALSNPGASHFLVSPIQSQQEQEIKSSVINGIGQWNSWRRNFSTPLLAFLDLFDNALDATGFSKEGRITVRPDRPLSGQQSDNEVTGLVMMNNSVEPIKPMSEILRVYNSVKGHSAAHIGQNGVGLKQGCATLSPTSFCLVKNHNRTYSLGILAASLQTEEQCFLPVLTELSGTPLDRIASMEAWGRKNADIFRCIEEYGMGDFLSGVERLDKHFTHISRNKHWRDHRNVFCLVLMGLYHETSDKSSDDDSSETEDPQGERVDGLVKELVKDLPRRYLHVPSHVTVKICGRKIDFSYWQYRMAEMAQFNLNINKKILFLKDDNWKKPQPDEDQDGCYMIRAYIGFDFRRLTEENQEGSGGSNLHLYVYSRQSGRLIKATEDARVQLGLSAGSSDFSQGMTIIVDDYLGNLPLNPTKQDIAYSEESHGENHRRNLAEWLRVAAKIYYRYYLENRYGSSKELITGGVKWVAARWVEEGDRLDFPDLSQCRFNTFQGKLVTSSTETHLKIASVKSHPLVEGKDSKVFQMPTKDVLLSDPRFAVRLNNNKRKRRSSTNEGPLLEDFQRLQDLVVELKRQLAEANKSSPNNAEHNADSAKEIRKLTAELRKVERTKSLLQMDNDMMRNEIKTLSQTLKQKERTLEAYRSSVHEMDADNADPSTVVI